MENGDDIVCLDESFFVNDNYELTKFTFGSQVLELYCLQAASTDFDLTGQLVWPGAMLMNDYLSKNAELLQGCTVIELGSGVGITGILCSRFCREVLLTDHNDEVIKILKKNIALHASLEDSRCHTDAEKLEWGNSDHLHQILQRYSDGFDLILGADIYILVHIEQSRNGGVMVFAMESFQQSSIPLLFDTVERLLHIRGRGRCKFILAYVSRTKMMDSMVISEAKKHGLLIAEISGSRSIVGNLEGVIFEITLK